MPLSGMMTFLLMDFTLAPAISRIVTLRDDEQGFWCVNRYSATAVKI